MRGEILNADEDGFSRWDRFLAEHADVGLYCQSVWLRFLCRVYGLPVRLAVCMQGDRILAGIPLVESRSFLFGHRLSNNPFSQYGEFPSQSPEAAVVAAQVAVDLARELNVKSLALRLASRTQPLPNNAAGLTALSNRVIPLLHLGPQYEDIFRNYKKQFRTNLRKAWQLVEDEGCTVETTSDEAGYRRFYPVLLHLFRSKHAMFPAPLDHFLALPRLLGAGRAQLHTLLRRGKAIAGMVILQHEGLAYYSWSASLPESEPLDGGAVLLDHVVRSLCAQGARQLDMGATSSTNTSLLFFKGRFNPEMTRPWHYHFSPQGTPLKDMSAETSMKGPRAVLKALPLPLFDMLGRALYKHMA